MNDEATYMCRTCMNSIKIVYEYKEEYESFDPVNEYTECPNELAWSMIEYSV